MTREERLERMIKTVREYEKAYFEICETCKGMANESCKKPQSEWSGEIEKLHEKMGDAALDLGKDLIELMTCCDKIPDLMLPMFDQMLFSLSKAVSISIEANQMLFSLSKAVSISIEANRKDMASDLERRGVSVDDVHDAINGVYDHFWDGVE